MNLLLVGLGGFLGSVCRYMISQTISKDSGSFPLSTFAVNIIGSLLIGVFYGLSQGKISEDIRLFATVGFCGGFTTFSTFALENLKLLQSGNYFSFFVYILLSTTVCIAAVLSGVYLSK
ncbi:fluoride efflux transporter CrcB [Leptospira selangorensis]|uniref:Fluoride-specific ion channel FluC n=1 Tax=Leptospira selangorensis TaxID=2484982 RepID=A0A4R9GEN0_9LEPT|nr:fluoride efflux transporter CrcB [Leptospira selangorensis]TGK09720.1 fluoride efflux transporter CrcB [Leptospira selangorensis]TGM12831.1 fluoride efflux transporter CrcB [Leptospira selangorensis]TGM30892.1 fluoride efflux transporter CrcB [Leptospira selangorensis]